ncbi:MAG: hypothetical protein VX949_09870 [Planctomycetota bacterium]|nr:hypothetical protein [Planctomycetota bacterium]
MIDNFSGDRPRYLLLSKGLMRFLVAVFLFSTASTIHIFMAGPGASALGTAFSTNSLETAEVANPNGDIEAPEAASQDDDVPKPKLTEQEAAMQIISVEARIPEDVRKPVGMTLRELQDLTDQTLIRGEKYLQDFPEGDSRSQVIPILCRLYLMNSSRTFIDATRLYKERTGTSPDPSWIKVLRANYFTRILGHLEEALAGIDEGESDCKLVRLKADTFWHSQQYSRAIAQYRLLVERCSSMGDLDVVRCALLNSQLRDHDHSGAVSTADSFLANHSDSELLPHVLHLRGKALMEAGRLLDALAWWKSIEDVIHAAATGAAVVLGGETVPISAKTRADFQRYHEEINFTLGFIEFALGEYRSAEQSFREEKDLLLARQSENLITNVGQVYINRTDRVYDSLVRLAGKPSPPLDLGDGWIANVSLDPIQEQGNVVLLLFAPYENVRYRDVLKKLQELYNAHWHEGLRVAWVAIPKGQNDLPGQMAKLAHDASSKGLAFPVGMELDKDYSNYRAYNCAVGGGTLVAIDRKGNFCWYKMDPTFRDDSIISVVARRLLESDSGQK